MPYYRHGPRFTSCHFTGTERTKDFNRGLSPPAPIQCSFSCKRQSLALPVGTLNNAALPAVKSLKSVSHPAILVKYFLIFHFTFACFNGRLTWIYKASLKHRPSKQRWFLPTRSLSKKFISQICISKIFISQIFISKIFISQIFISKIFISQIFISKIFISQISDIYI